MSELKLFDYQKEFVDATENKIVCNWARCLGKDFSLLMKILREKPNVVVYNGLQYNLNNMKEKITEIRGLNKSIIGFVKIFKECIIIEYDNNTSTKIYAKTNTNYSVTNHVDWEICLHSNQKPSFNARKVFYLISENNYDRDLQKKLEGYRFIEADYTKGLNNGLLEKLDMNNMRKDLNYAFYKEFAIFDNPNEIIDDNNKFLKEILLKLKREYGNLPNSKDTVLTRQNLLHMILEIKHELDK